MATKRTGDETAAGTDGTRPPADFERAEHALFESVGLQPESRFVDVETPGVRTHVLTSGRFDDEPPLVFVHGTGAFGAFFAPLMARFEDAGWIAFDRPGYGRSGPFRYSERTIRRTVLDVLEGVLDSHGCDRIDLVGHSMGGHTSLLFAGVFPERVRNVFVVGSVPGFPGTRPPIPIRVLTAPLLGRVVRRLQKPGVAGVLDIAEVFGEREAIRKYPAVVRAMAAHEATPKSSLAGYSEFRSLVSPLSLSGWSRPNRITPAELRRVRAPVTVVWGGSDTLGKPDDVRESVAQLRNARFEAVDAGHIPFLAHPDRCAQLIREARSG